MLYVGSKGGVEKRMIEKIGIPYEGVHCGKLRRYFSWQNFVDVFKVPLGVWAAAGILRRFKPDVVFSKGGFVSFPVCVAAWKLGIPVVLHESDLHLGMANKWIAGIASTICVSFEETIESLPEKLRGKAVYTGTPIRAEILAGDKEAGLGFCGFNDYKPVVLVMGGSSGAEQLNILVRAGMDELLKKYQIVHICGRGKLDISAHSKGYKQFEYLDEQMKDIYAASDVAVTRGGANSLFELAALRKKAVVVPLSMGASRGDQIDNARVFVKDFGWYMLNGDVGREDFINAVNVAFMQNVGSGKVKNGAKEVVDLLIST